jgi:hypothetical protein
MLPAKHPEEEVLKIMSNKIAVLAAFALSLLASSCGSSSPKAATSGALSGNWIISLTKTNATNIVHTQSGSLLQVGDTIGGSVIFVDTPCSGVGSVNGSISGSNVTLNVNPVGTSVTLTGTSGSIGSMSGNYTILSTGCIGSQASPESGTFTASLVTPLSGSVTGTFTSKNNAPSFTATGTITQAANTGLSATPLTGSLTFTGFCYPSANIVGSISGTSVVINLVDANGAQIGQISGTASLDGTLVGSATYNYLGQGAGSACVDGSSGTATLNIGS